MFPAIALMFPRRIRSKEFLLGLLAYTQSEYLS